MYTLTLTREDRAAIDWVGNRYAHGHELYRLLWENCPASPGCYWDNLNDIEFTVPEHIAWGIREIGKESNYLWDCFADELRNKLNDFCNKIV